MKRYRIQLFLLWVINKLENSPSYYARVNNVEVYARSFIDSFDHKKTIGQFLKEMDTMDECMKSGDNCTIIGGTVYKGELDLRDE